MSTSDFPNDFPNEIERHNLPLRVYLFVRCRNCGHLRAGVADIPESRLCRVRPAIQEAEYRIFGRGGTARSQPFWEREHERMFTPFSEMLGVLSVTEPENGTQRTAEIKKAPRGIFVWAGFLAGINSWAVR